MKLFSSREAYSYSDKLNGREWDGKQALIVFDGVCVLCNSFAHWVHRHDKNKMFLFTTAQSDLGQLLYKHFELNPTDYETNLVIIDGRVYEKMFAVFAVFKQIGWPWMLFYYLKILPRAFLNWCYDHIAKNRYMIFGKRHDCIIADEDMKKRLISGE